MTAIPAITKQVKFGQIEDVYSTEIAKLGEPFNALGVKNLTGEEGKCITGYADRFKISVSCVRSQTAYATLEDRSLTAEQIVANAQTLQNTLQAEGWKGIFAESDDATSLSKLVQNIAKGIDYTPDATYIKQVGSISCVFSSHTAFSAPDKPAFETQLWCGQEFYPFGLPEYLRLAQ